MTKTVHRLFPRLATLCESPPFFLRRHHSKRYSPAFLLIIPLQSIASDWLPTASINYDNRLAFNATVGAARRFYTSKDHESLYHYTDLSIGQYGKLLAFGIAGDAEGCFIKTGLGFLQVDSNGSKNNYAGFVIDDLIIISDSPLPKLFSIKLGLFSQTSDYKDIRALLGIGVGI